MANDDAALVRAASQGDTQAFAALIRKHQDAVYALAYSIVGDFADAQDLTQDAFLRAHLDLHQLRDPERFSAWLCQVTRNVCRMWLRRQRQQVPLDQISEAERQWNPWSTPAADPSQAAIQQELRQIVRDAVGSLRERDREALTLFYMDGLSYREIGDFLDVSVSTVESRLHRARKRLKGELLVTFQDELTEAALPPEFAEQTRRWSAETDACRRRLHKLGQALLTYQDKHGELPLWLSDLVPDTIIEPEELFCPCREHGSEDIRLPCSYRYFFRPTERTSDEFWMMWERGRDRRQEAFAKLASYGSVFPMIECRDNHRVNLFVCHDGELRECPRDDDWHRMPWALTGILEHLEQNLLLNPTGNLNIHREAFIRHLWLEDRADELVTVLRAVVVQQPTNPNAHRWWGEVCLNQEDFDGALTHLQLAHAGMGDDRLLNQIGDVAYRLHRLDIAEHSYQQTQNTRGLAALYGKTGESEKVRGLVQSQLSAPLSCLGLIAQAGGLIDDAIEIYRKIINWSRELARTHEQNLPGWTRTFAEQRLLECYQQTGKAGDAEALRAEMFKLPSAPTDAIDWEDAKYGLQGRWVEVSPDVVVQGDRIHADGSESDDAFIAKLAQTVPGVQLRSSLVLPINTEQLSSTLLPVTQTPCRGLIFGALFYHYQRGDSSVITEYGVECDGTGWMRSGENLRRPELGKTYLCWQARVSPSGELRTTGGVWEPRKGVPSRPRGGETNITDMQASEFSFGQVAPGTQGFYLFLRLLEVEQAQVLAAQQPPRFVWQSLNEQTPLPRDMDSLHSLIDSEPINVRAYADLAARHAERGETGEVRALMERFTRQYSLRSRADQLGRIYQAGKLYPEAIEMYQHSLDSVEPDSSDESWVRQQLLECYGQLEERGNADAMRASNPDVKTRLLGFPAPDFCLRDITGREHRLSGYRGRAVLLHIFGSHVGQSGLMSFIERLHQRYGNEGLVVLGVTKEHDLEKIHRETEGLITHPVCIDTEHVAAPYGLDNNTCRYLIDRAGIVQHAEGGSCHQPRLLNEIQRCLGNS